MTRDARPSRVSRLIALAVLVLLLMVFADATGLYDWFVQERVNHVVREAAQRSGWLGVLALAGLFTVGLLLQVPGVLFVGAAVLAYGGWAGGLIAFGSGLIAVTTSFALVRAVGGRTEAAAVRSRTMSRLLARIDRRPVWAVFLLRSIFWLSPPLNYALALSPIGLRDYVVGSAAGLALPIAGWALFFERAL